MHPTVACYAFHLTRKARHAGNRTNYACSLSLSFVLLTSDATERRKPLFQLGGLSSGPCPPGRYFGHPACREIACGLDASPANQRPRVGGSCRFPPRQGALAVPAVVSLSPGPDEYVGPESLAAVSSRTLAARRVFGV